VGRTGVVGGRRAGVVLAHVAARTTQWGWG
jgi:hypothetical protein